MAEPNRNYCSDVLVATRHGRHETFKYVPLVKVRLRIAGQFRNRTFFEKLGRGANLSASDWFLTRACDHALAEAPSQSTLRCADRQLLVLCLARVGQLAACPHGGLLLFASSPEKESSRPLGALASFWPLAVSWLNSRPSSSRCPQKTRKIGWLPTGITIANHSPFSAQQIPPQNVGNFRLLGHSLRGVLRGQRSGPLIIGK